LPGTALVGAYRLGAQIFRKLGLTIETTNSDASDFQYNRIAIRANTRLTLACYRPTGVLHCHRIELNHRRRVKYPAAKSI
jgi:hypothetical protein